MTDGISEKDLNRVIGEIDFSDVEDKEDYYQVRDAVQNRFGEWKKNYPQRVQAFTRAINDRYAGTRYKSWKQNIIDSRTTLAGKSGHRYTIIRDSKGHFFGKPENIQYYQKAGGELWGVNSKTGKRSKIS